MVAGFLGGQARAADDEPNPLAHRTVLTARLPIPLLGDSDKRSITLTGIFLGQRFLNLVEVEAGMSAQMQLICEDGFMATVRAGLSPSVLTPRPSGTHWNLRIPLLAAFSYYNGEAGKCDEYRTYTREFYIYHFDTGLDATYWGKSGIGFNMRFLVNMGSARTPQAPNDQTSSHSGVVGGSFMIGVSFAGL